MEGSSIKVIEAEAFVFRGLIAAHAGIIGRRLIPDGDSADIISPGCLVGLGSIINITRVFWKIKPICLRTGTNNVFNHIKIFFPFKSYCIFFT